MISSLTLTHTLTHPHPHVTFLQNDLHIQWSIIIHHHLPLHFHPSRRSIISLIFIIRRRFLPILLPTVLSQTSLIVSRNEKDSPMCTTLLFDLHVTIIVQFFMCVYAVPQKECALRWRHQSDYFCRWSGIKKMNVQHGVHFSSDGWMRRIFLSSKPTRKVQLIKFTPIPTRNDAAHFNTASVPLISFF